MSSQRAARKARQIAQIQPKAVWIERKLINVKDISEELKNRGYVFPVQEINEEVLPDGD